MADIKKLLLNEPEKVQKMAFDIFQELDTDGSGFIERDEMREMLTLMAVQLGQPEPDDEELDKEIDKIDENGDGMIDPEEFTQVIISVLEDMAHV